MAPSARGRGIASAALAALTEFAWTRPDVNRVELFIEPSNLASIAVADRCGYRRQELVAGHSDFGGIRRDMLRWSHDRPANSS